MSREEEQLKMIKQARSKDPRYHKGCTSQKVREWAAEYSNLIYAGFSALEKHCEKEINKS